jgi:hypothetical protein
MKRILGHILDMPFVTAVSIAALLHSTWSLSTYFTGAEPTPQFTPLWFGWLIPGALIGIAIDIGILSIAIELKHGQRGKAKLAAFFVLSTAMFYLQFLYLAAHTPLVPIAPGVSAGWLTVATTLRDLSVWVIPALLPLACLLYAFSDRKGSTPARQNRDQRRSVLIEGMEAPALEGVDSAAALPEQVMNLDAKTGKRTTMTQETPAAKAMTERNPTGKRERTKHRPTLPAADANGSSPSLTRAEPSPVQQRNGQGPEARSEGI